MKKMLRIASIVACAWLGSRVCELSYRTTFYADCDAKCFIRKHYMFGHCILTEFVDTPFLNGGFHFVPQSHASVNSKVGNLIPIQTRSFIIYDPRGYFGGIERYLRSDMDKYLINQEEENCHYQDSDPRLIRAFVFERVKAKNVTPDSMTFDQFEEWSNETRR